MGSAAACEFEGLSRVSGLRRVLEMAAVDALSPENSVTRSRVLIAAVHAAARLLEMGELGERLAALETAIAPRLAPKRIRSRAVPAAGLSALPAGSTLARGCCCSTGR